MVLYHSVLFYWCGDTSLLLRKTLFFYERVKGFVLNIWEGIMSLKGVRNIPLFIFYTLAIWACYFLHFYFTFYCFAFTAHLGILAALVMFVGGTFAVIVPTPNGAGPWHFAIISMMMLYGVNVTDAGIFALIVHGIQTFWLFYWVCTAWLLCRSPIDIGRKFLAKSVYSYMFLPTSFVI